MVQMSYVHGASVNKPATLRKTADQVRADLENLRRIEAQILAESAAKEKELARIRAARKKLEPKATYKPTPEAIAAWEEFQANHTNPHGDKPSDGYRRRKEAAAEAAHHDATKREAA